MSDDASKQFPSSGGLEIERDAARAIDSAGAAGVAGAAGRAANPSQPASALCAPPAQREPLETAAANAARRPGSASPRDAAATEHARRGALAGLKIVDLSRVLGGPYCTQALADHGARVIKIEPPAGDETRGWGPPFFDDDAWYFIGVNRNKEGIALDLSRDEGRAILWRLLEDADVLVENFKPGTLARWGMDYERDLRPRFPRLVHCAITGFGADGPLGGLPGYDAVIQAMAGLMLSLIHI